MKRYNPKDLEPKWQKAWADQQLYKAVDFDERPKFVMLTEFPYPSGDGLHLGHVREYTLGDIISRRQRMAGKNVLYPMGYDAFGLPTENFAIKNKIAPQVATDQNVANFQEQFSSLGYSIDWSRSFRTTDPDYYKWTQWLFLQFYKAGLAYQDEIAINWCPKCKTGLANEEVVNGRHERCDTPVEKKFLKQWILKITEYADRLIEGLRTVDYPSRIADQQVNWIGRSIGAEVDFEVDSKFKFVLLHGFTGTSKGDFQPWLKTELEKQGHEVYAPDLPNTDHPDAEEQAKFVLDNFKFDENTVLIGHSYGTVTALRILEQLKQPIHKYISVAGFAEPKFLDKLRPFEETTNWNFDFSKIKNNVQEITFLRASNDTAVPQERSDSLLKNLKGEIVDFVAEADHVCGEQEPVVLQNALQNIRVFTTRPDTLFGATYMVLAPEHPLVAGLTRPDTKEAVEKYIQEAASKTDLDRQADTKEKTGVFTGSYAINPVNGAKVPIWISDYVLMGYGTGAIMAVPAHDERDFAFAKEFGLPIKRVIKNKAADDECTTAEGTMMNSGSYDGMPSQEAREEIVKDLEKAGKGKEKVNYKLRDWVFSRQHYWGEPIPIIHCACSGAVPVPEDQLPVELPPVDHYEPTDTGESPLAAIESWVNVDCPKCGKPAQRETDTMPNWAGSSWYYLRYYDAHNDKAFADPEKLKYWGEVDLYLGGMEHTTLHLLYSRFWHQFLYDQKLVPTPEPYAARRGQGIILAEDGSKMSKSKGNVVNPTDIIDQGYGADAVRLSIVFLAPYDQTTPWNSEGVAGTFRFLQRFWTLVQEYKEAEPKEYDSAELHRITHQAIFKVSDDLEKMNFNTAIAALMQATNEFYKLKAERGFSKDWQTDLAKITQLLAPFAPHITEEIWQDLGQEGSIHTSPWPVHDKKYLEQDEIIIVVQVNGKVRANISVSKDASKEEVIKTAKANGKVAEYLKEKEVRKEIYVPHRLVNFVV